MQFKREQFHQIPANEVRRGHDWIIIPDSVYKEFEIPEEIEAFPVEHYYKPQLRYEMYKGVSVVMFLSITQGRVSFEPERVYPVKNEWFQVFITQADIHSLMSAPWVQIVCLFSALCPVYVLKEEFIPEPDV